MDRGLRNHSAIKYAIYVFWISIFLQIIRAPYRVMHGCLWAEDGMVFLVQAYELGPQSLLTPYSGYLCSVPRIIALFQVSFFSLKSAPYLFAWISLVLGGLACGLTTYLSFCILASERYKKAISALMGLSLIAVPAGPEVFVNVTNAQWILAPVLFLVLVESTMARLELSTYSNAWRVFAVLLLGANGLYILFYAPVFLALIVLRLKQMNGSVIPIIFAFIVASAIQLTSLFLCGASGKLFPLLHSFTGHMFAETLFGRLLFPTHILGIIISAGFQTALWIAVILCLSLVIVSQRYRVAVTILLSLTVGFFCVSVIRAKFPAMSYFGPFFNGERYFYLPAVFLFWAIIISFYSGKPFLKPIPMLLGLLMLFTSSISFVSRWDDRWTITQVSSYQYKLQFAPRCEAYIDIAKSE